jgi:hypothetical protein
VPLGSAVPPEAVPSRSWAAVERAPEAGELDVVERDREVAERGAHGVTLEPDVEPAAIQRAVADDAGVAIDRVELVRVEVRQQPVAARVVEVAEQLVHLAPLRVERRGEQVLARHPAAQVPGDAALVPDSPWPGRRNAAPLDLPTTPSASATRNIFGERTSMSR